MPAAEGDLSGSHLIVEGQFVAIHEGDETKRIMIGFGRGASDIKTHVTVSSLIQGHPTVVLNSTSPLRAVKSLVLSRPWGSVHSLSGRQPKALATGSRLWKLMLPVRRN